MFSNHFSSQLYYFHGSILIGFYLCLLSVRININLIYVFWLSLEIICGNCLLLCMLHLLSGLKYLLYLGFQNLEDNCCFRGMFGWERKLIFFSKYALSMIIYHVILSICLNYQIFTKIQT